MPWEQAPALYAKLLTSDNPQAHALRFLLLCCTPRTDEILGALWSETTTWSPVKDHADAGDRAGMTLLPTCPRMAPCSPPSSTLRVGSADGHRPCLTATARDALRAPGRDEETGPRQPNKETWLAM
jgi:hypothetical protein